MAILDIAWQYILNFAPNIPTYFQLTTDGFDHQAPKMGNIYSKSILGSSPAGPRPFNRLPAELRWQIWKYAAEEFVTQYLADVRYWTVAGKHIYLISLDSDIHYLGRDASGNIDSKKGYIIELPPLLFVCHESRNIMFDALLTFRYCTETKRGLRAPKILRSSNIQVYMRDSSCQGNNLWCPQVFNIYISCLIL